MKKIDWKYVSSELIDCLMIMEEQEEVIERLLGLMTIEQLKSLDWFDNKDIEEVYDFIKRGYSYFDVYPTFEQFVNMGMDEKIPEWQIELYDEDEDDEDDDYEYDEEWEKEDKRIKVRALNETDARYCVEHHLYGGIFRVKSIKEVKE